MKSRLIVSLALSFFVCGCVASVQPAQKSNLTPGMAKTKIIKGQTTQSEVLEVFGAPNIVTQNKSGNEVWTYDKASVEKSGSDAYGTIILAGLSAARSSATSRTFTLMIEFDNNEVVKDYSYRASSF